jgi:hypothetical protein
MRELKRADYAERRDGRSPSRDFVII